MKSPGKQTKPGQRYEMRVGGVDKEGRGELYSWASRVKRSDQEIATQGSLNIDRPISLSCKRTHTAYATDILQHMDDTEAINQLTWHCCSWGRRLRTGEEPVVSWGGKRTWTCPATQWQIKSFYFYLSFKLWQYKVLPNLSTRNMMIANIRLDKKNQRASDSVTTSNKATLRPMAWKD